MKFVLIAILVCAVCADDLDEWSARGFSEAKCSETPEPEPEPMGRVTCIEGLFECTFDEPEGIPDCVAQCEEHQQRWRTALDLAAMPHMKVTMHPIFYDEITRLIHITFGDTDLIYKRNDRLPEREHISISAAPAP